MNANSIIIELQLNNPGRRLYRCEANLLKSIKLLRWIWFNFKWIIRLFHRTHKMIQQEFQGYGIINFINTSTWPVFNSLLGCKAISYKLGRCIKRGSKESILDNYTAMCVFSIFMPINIMSLLVCTLSLRIFWIQFFIYDSVRSYQLIVQADWLKYLFLWLSLSSRNKYRWGSTLSLNHCGMPRCRNYCTSDRQYDSVFCANFSKQTTRWFHPDK